MQQNRPFIRILKYSSTILLVISLLIFYQNPYLDLDIAIYINNMNYLQSPVWHFFSELIYWIGWVFPLILCIICFRHKRRPDYFILTSYLCSVVVATHLIIKPLWGRLRPIELFQSQMDAYTSIFQWSNSCHFNCSFVSGHAAFGFFFISYAIIYPKYQKSITCFALLLGFFIGTIRMIEAQHFLSDILFAAWINMFIIAHIATIYRKP